MVASPIGIRPEADRLGAIASQKDSTVGILVGTHKVLGKEFVDYMQKTLQADRHPSAACRAIRHGTSQRQRFRWPDLVRAPLARQPAGCHL